MPIKSIREVIDNLDQSQLAESEEQVGFSQARCFVGEDRQEVCAVCAGRGWYVEENIPIRCENYLPGLDTRLQNTLIEKANIQNFTRRTLDNFYTGEELPYTMKQRQELIRMRWAAKGFARDPIGWLVYEGTYGCGKTHLAVGIAFEIIRSLGKAVIFTTSSDLLDSLRDTFSKNESVTLSDVMRRLEEIPVLIIDDYGAEKTTEWAREKLFQVLNHRHIYNMPTVITTNMKLNDMPPRIRSRMMEDNVVKYIKMKLPDYREMTSQIHEGPQIPPLHERYSSMKLSTFRVQRQDRREQRILEYAKETIERWMKNTSNPLLSIIGNHGVGKTHLLASIAHIKYEQSIRVLICTAGEINDTLHQSLDKNTETKPEQHIHEYINADYLLIDDLDKYGLSNWSIRQISNVLVERIDVNRPTAVTSMNGLKSLNTRLASRLNNHSFCELRINVGPFRKE